MDRERFLGTDRATVVTSIGLGLSNDEATKDLPAVKDDLVDRVAPGASTSRW
ncbi:hypothetical protein [Nocardia transvalensis]|uniref:hypothetical protein n=1 Tax=Nocardia transvalensis TaxID=37333 RepID=UPI0018939167|nr:hypothetical protein [Nocardia transvalensis]MBF6332797.1 hypothetical protein [Nocardia transvalensis]